MYSALGQTSGYVWYFLYGPPATGAKSDQFLGWIYTDMAGASIIAKRASGESAGYLKFSATSGTGWQQLQRIIQEKTGQYSSTLKTEFLGYYFPATPQVSQVVRSVMRGTTDSNDWIRKVRVYTPERFQIR